MSVIFDSHACGKGSSASVCRYAQKGADTVVMAPSISVGLIVVVIWLSWIDATPIKGLSPNPNPVCTPYCKRGLCSPVQVTKVEDGVCTCSRVMLKWNTWFEHRLWVEEAQNNTLVVKWRLKHQPRSESSVLYLPKGDGGVCFKITTNKMPTWAETVKIICTHRDQIDTEDRMFRLLDVDKYENIANLTRPSHTGSGKSMKRFHKGRRSKRRKSSGKRAAIRTGCDCWIPDRVSIQRVDNTSLEVTWDPFRADSDVRVRVVPWGVEGMYSKKDKTIALPTLCEHHINSFRFNNFTPGYYVGMVGSLGCNCIGYKESDPFLLEGPYEEKTTLGPTLPATRTISNKRPDKYIQLIAIIVVGVLAFIGCASLGTVCLVQNGFRCCSPYHTISKFPKDPAKPKIVIVEGIHDTAATEIATWIKKQLVHPNNEVSLTKTDKLSLHVGLKDLLVLVSLQDIQTFQGPMIDHSLSMNTITVLMDYSTDTYTGEQCPLVVHVPAGLSHQRFKMRNNETEQMQILGLEETLQRLNPECDLGSQDVAEFLEKTRDFAENRRNEIRRIFLISGCDHPLHIDACMELTRMLRILGKEVVYLFESTNRKAIQQSLPVWTMNQANSADLVLVVGSEVLFKLVQCFENETDLPNNLQNQAICAPLTLKMLSDQTLKSKIAYVSFGYGSTYIDRIIKVYPLISSDMRYDLVETKECAVEDDDNRRESRSLRLFFSRLSADHSLVLSAADHSSVFFKRVEEMSVVMANDSDWLKTTYGSMESLVSLITISDRSIIFSHRGYDTVNFPGNQDVRI